MLDRPLPTTRAVSWEAANATSHLKITAGLATQSDNGDDTPKTLRCVMGVVGRVRRYVLQTQLNTTDAIRLYRSHRAGMSG